MRRNPNGYGCITKLKGNRARPWIIKVTQYDEYGLGHQVVIGYAATEKEARLLLADYNHEPWDISREKVTVADVYNRWLETKAKQLAESSVKSMKSHYKYLHKFYGTKYRSIKAYHMQSTIDECGKGYSTQNVIKALWNNLDKVAFEMDIIEKMYSQLITVEPAPPTSRVPFTQEQVDTLWKYSDRYSVQVILLYLYTGFRLMELINVRTEDVDMDAGTITSGIKTANGRNRVVPIHHRIMPIVQKLYGKHEYLIYTPTGKKFSHQQFYATILTEVNQILGADKTMHEARHYFATALDDAKANKKCIDMLMGHKSKDVGTRVYTHKTIEQLRETIELIP